jgi:hypothetical protein
MSKYPRFYILIQEQKKEAALRKELPNKRTFVTVVMLGVFWVIWFSMFIMFMVHH